MGVCIRILIILNIMGFEESILVFKGLLILSGDFSNIVKRPMF
jgi:hypothetical protein